MKNIGLFIRSRMEFFLQREGFATAKDGLSYGRMKNDLIQNIVFLKTKYKGAYMVFCGFRENVDCISDVSKIFTKDQDAFQSGVNSFFFLTPIAPFQGNYDWYFNDEASSIASINEIIKLIEITAMPIFSIIDSTLNLKAISERENIERTKKNTLEQIGENLRDDGYKMSSFGKFLWKENGSVIAIIVPEILGLGCFLKINLVLWSPYLDGKNEMATEPPEDFSGVAFVYISNQGITNDGVKSLWPFGNKLQKEESFQSIIQTLKSQNLLSWLNEHCSTSSILEIVSDDLKPYVQRDIDEVMMKFRIN